MTDSIQPLLQLHQRFCELAGIDGNDLRFHKAWSHTFWDFSREGFTEEEMILVVKYIQAQNKKREPEYRRKIVPSLILGNIERFCEDLAEAKRLQALRVTPRQQAINEFRRCPAPESLANTAQPVRDVLLKAITKDPMTL